MSTIKSSSEHLTLNADGASKDIKFQANGVQKASISSAGAFTSTTIDATALTGALPAISGANLTGLVSSLASMSDATVSASDPTVTSNPSAVGHLWINSTSGEQFVCTDITTNENYWLNQTGGTDVQLTKGLTSDNAATGAQEVADTGGTSGAYYINNYTTGDTTQQVYCWIGVNGDNWQKWSPFNTHIGSAHGHATSGCTGSLTDNFSATTANQAGDFKKYTGTSGCGGNSKNTTGWWDGKLVSTMDGLKIMITSERENTANASFVMNHKIQMDTTSPSAYNDDGAGKTAIINQITQGDNGVGIFELNHSGTNVVMSGEWWVNGAAPSDFVLTSSASTAPSSPSYTDTSSSIAQGSNQLWINNYAWADYGPDTYQTNTWWVNT